MTDSELNKRIRNALVLLPEGHPFKVGELTLQCPQPNVIQVKGWSISHDLKAIKKRSALSELTETKDMLTKMMSASEELASFVKDKQMEFILAFDYGMGSVHICKEIEGEVHWEYDIKQ